MELHIVSDVAEYITIEHIAYAACGLMLVTTGIYTITQCLALIKEIKKKIKWNELL